MTGKRKVSEEPEHLLIHIGLRILRRRKDLGLTQQDLAERTAMVRGNIAQMEHGARNLTIRTLCRLAAALEMTVGELVTGAPPPDDREP